MSFHETSESITLEDGHILYCQVADSDGNWCDGMLDLNYYLGNNNGWFEWGAQNFSESAEWVTLDLDGDGFPILRAALVNLEGEVVESYINLGERVGNDNGVLIFVEY